MNGTWRCECGALNPDGLTRCIECGVLPAAAEDECVGGKSHEWIRTPHGSRCIRCHEQLDYQEHDERAVSDA